MRLEGSPMISEAPRNSHDGSQAVMGPPIRGWSEPPLITIPRAHAAMHSGHGRSSATLVSATTSDQKWKNVPLQIASTPHSGVAW